MYSSSCHLAIAASLNLIRITWRRARLSIVVCPSSERLYLVRQLCTAISTTRQQPDLYKRRVLTTVKKPHVMYLRHRLAGRMSR